MKGFLFVAFWMLLLSGPAFAQNTASDTPKTADAPSAPKQSPYKSKPQINYHSNKSGEGDPMLDNLKPMLNQAFGNNNPAGSVGNVMPSGTMSF